MKPTMKIEKVAAKVDELQDGRKKEAAVGKVKILLVRLDVRLEGQ